MRTCGNYSKSSVWATMYRLPSTNSPSVARDITSGHHEPMSRTHRKTGSNFFRASIEALFTALGASTIECRGSRVRFELNGVVAAFHRPHPQKEAKPYQVRDAREFLEKAGVHP